MKTKSKPYKMLALPNSKKVRKTTARVIDDLKDYVQFVTLEWWQDTTNAKHLYFAFAGQHNGKQIFRGFAIEFDEYDEELICAVLELEQEELQKYRLHL
jgi:hypothetical protein